MIERFLTILIICFSGEAFSQALVSGKINNYDGETKVYYSYSEDGVLPLIGEYVQPKRNGEFQLNLNSDQLGKVNFSYKKFRATLFFTENSNIKISLNEDDLESLSISGDLSKINNYYHSISSSMPSPLISVNGNEHSRFIANLDAPDLVLDALDSMIQGDLNSIYAIEKINLEESSVSDLFQEVKKHLINEIKAYYGEVFLNAMHLKKMNQLIAINRDPTAKRNIYNDTWKSLIESFNNSIREEIEPTPNSPYYNEFMRLHSVVNSTYQDDEFNEPATIDMSVYETLVGYDSLLFNDSKTVFAYKLNYLKSYLETDLYYSPALLDITNQLKSEYPDSHYWHLLEPNIDRMRNSIVASGKRYKEAEIIKTNYTTFQDLLNQFSGKSIYIDIWATWCLPCIKEFQHNEEVNTLLGTEIERLFISIDQQRFAERWEQSIKYNELEGYHVRANTELLIDMWDEIGGQKGAIPRYVLIDNSGNIFKAEAASPSNKELLVKQIKELFPN